MISLSEAHALSSGPFIARHCVSYAPLRTHNALSSAMPPDMRDTWRMLITTRPSGFVEIGLRHIETNNLIGIVSRPEYGCDWFLHCSTGRERFKSRKAALARLFAFASNLASNLGL